MDPISAVSLAGTVVQLVDFSIKIVSKSSELYRSGSDGPVENQSIDKATKDLTKLNDQLKDSSVSDSDLLELCKACGDAADELLTALSKVKVDGKGRTWQSFRKALRSIWSKEEIQELEKRLARFRDELNLRLTAGLRDDLSLLKDKHSDQFKKLNEMEKVILDAIIQQTDVFSALHNAQSKLHRETQLMVRSAIERDGTKTREFVSEAFQKSWMNDVVDEIVRTLSAPDPSTNYRRAVDTRQSSTGLWFLESDQYRNFKGGQVQAIWLHGIPGCGKSVLSSTIIDDLHQLCGSGTRSIVLYFYFDFSDPLKRTPDLMIRSIITQLVRNVSAIPDAAAKLFSSLKSGNRQGSIEEYLTALQYLVQEFSRVFLVLDALDECYRQGTGMKELRKILTTITEWNIETLHLIVTSRRERDIESWLDGLVGSPNIISLQSDIVDKDIQLYVRERLSNDEHFEKWKRYPGLRDEIENALKGAHGMFRWAACQLDELIHCRNAASLRKNLASLPPTLNETYERILLSIRHDDVEYATRILRWLTVSERPLQLEELTEVAALHPDREVPFDENEILVDPLEVLDICSSLVSQTNSYSGQKALILAHYSVKEYLISDDCKNGRAAQFSATPKACHKFIAASCLSYLQLLDDDYFACHRAVNLGRYSAQFWFRHARASPFDQAIVQQALALMSASNTAYYNWIKLHDPDDPYGIRSSRSVSNPLYYASLLGLVEVVPQLLAVHGADVNAQGGEYGNALQAASSEGHDKIVEVLLAEGADVNAQGGEYGNALQAASYRGYDKIVEVLLAEGADVNAQGGGFGNALQAASYGGRDKIVEVLLAEGADVNAQGGRFGNALQAASYRGHDKIVEVLLAEGADVNAQGGGFGNALQAASYRGHDKIVEVLLARGASWS